MELENGAELEGLKRIQKQADELTRSLERVYHELLAEPMPPLAQTMDSFTVMQGKV